MRDVRFLLLGSEQTLAPAPTKSIYGIFSNVFTENTAAPQSPKAEAGALDRYFKIKERGSTLGAEFRGGLATFFANELHRRAVPLIIRPRQGRIRQHARCTAGRKAMTALVAGVVTILMGVIAKAALRHGRRPRRERAAGNHHRLHPRTDLPAIMGLVVWADVLMTILVLTGFRTAVFNAVLNRPRS